MTIFSFYQKSNALFSLFLLISTYIDIEQSLVTLLILWLYTSTLFLIKFGKVHCYTWPITSSCNVTSYKAFNLCSTTHLTLALVQSHFWPITFLVLPCHHTSVLYTINISTIPFMKSCYNRLIPLHLNCTRFIRQLYPLL